VETSAARDLIADRLRQDGFALREAAVADAEALIARRSQWQVTVKQHEFVVIFTVDGLSGDEAALLADAAQTYAIRHKGGLPRGLQTGTATTVVFLDGNPRESAVEWIDRSPVHRHAALRFSVLIDVTKHEVVYWDGRWISGGIFRDRTLELLRDSILAPLSGTSGDSNLPLKHRRASCTQEAKLAAAITASRMAMRRSAVLFALASTIAATVACYLLEGVGAAICCLVLFGGASALGAWLVPRSLPEHLGHD
jgi:hypothetical protein